MTRYSGLIIIFLLVLAHDAFAFFLPRGLKEGNASYQKGEYEKAVEKYKEALKGQPNSDIINFNLGTGLYKSGRYDEAIESLQRSLLTDKESLKTKTTYNLGNSYYKSGIAKEKTNIQAAINSLENSLDYFEKTLTADKKDEDAQYNYEFVKKELERLKKKQQQQQKQQQEKQQQQPQQDKSSAQDQGSRDQQQDQSQSQEPQQKESQEEAKPKENSGGGEQKEQGQPKAQNQPEDNRQQKVQPRSLSEEEAQRLLREYQQREEPQGLLNTQPSRPQEQPVLKDW